MSAPQRRGRRGPAWAGLSLLARLQRLVRQEQIGEQGADVARGVEIVDQLGLDPVGFCIPEFLIAAGHPNQCFGG